MYVATMTCWANDAEKSTRQITTNDGQQNKL